MEDTVDQMTLDLFIAQSLERHTKKLIAGVLGDMESFTGVKDTRRSQIVKDLANYSKRVILTRLTGLEVEPSHDPSKRQRPTQQAE